MLGALAISFLAAAARRRTSAQLQQMPRCTFLYDILRLKLIHETNLDALCELVDILKIEVIGEQLTILLLKSLTRPSQIANYFPLDEDLNYHAKLEQSTVTKSDPSSYDEFKDDGYKSDEDNGLNGLMVQILIVTTYCHLQSMVHRDLARVAAENAMGNLSFLLLTLSKTLTYNNSKYILRVLIGNLFEYDSEHNILLQSSPEDAVNNVIVRCKVLDLLEIMQFRSPDTIYREHNILPQSSPEDAVNNAIVRCKVLDMPEIMQFRSPDTSIKHLEVLFDKKFGPVVWILKKWTKIKEKRNKAEHGNGNSAQEPEVSSKGHQSQMVNPWSTHKKTKPSKYPNNP
ncbi:hypothetical protein Tco_0238168 [Tanacetum coccineum]